LTGVEGRLVTLTGPGGTGKTRLALQAAAEVLEHFSSGVFVVQLSPIRDPELVVPTIARTFALKEAPGQPVFESVLEYLEDKELLLVFDNFEQVVDAAPVVADLLQGCPGLKALVTSRAPLQVRAEREFPVSPLLEADGVALFTERALAKRPDFSVSAEVGEICRRPRQRSIRRASCRCGEGETGDSDAPCSPIHARRLACLESHLRSALGEDALVRAEAEGAELPLEAAATEAVNLLRTNLVPLSQ
jgi:predicted ATPase